MITFAQTTGPAIENLSAEVPVEEVNTSPTGDDMSEETETPARSVIPEELEVEIQRQINELRREQMDDRETYFDRLLAIVAIVIAVAGYFGFKQFREIKAEAGQNVMASKQYAEEARHLVEEITVKRHEAESLVEIMNAQTVADNPVKAMHVVTDVFEDPEASLIQKAIAKALELQQKGRNEEALKKWQAIIGIAEGTDNDLAARAWFSVGYLLLDEDLEGSVSAYDWASRLNPGYVEAYTGRGIAKSKMGRYADAIADHDEAIRLKPDYAAAYTNRGIAKSEMGQNADAIADHDEAIRLEPDGGAAYTNRGNAKKNMGRYADAIADYDEAIRLKPDLPEAFTNRGIAEKNMGRYADAIADHDEAIRLKRDYAEAYSNRGIAKSEMGRHTDAIADHDEAIRLKPNLAGAYSNRGIAKQGAGQYEAAIADYDEAIRLNPNIAAAYLNRGNAKAMLNLKDEARQDIEIALEMAQKAGDVNVWDAVEQSLRELNDAEDS